MKEQLLLLFAVQETDSALDAIKREYHALNPGHQEKAAYDTAKAAYLEAKAALEVTQTAVRDAELELQSLAKKRTDEETKLYSGKITNPKELTALQEEVAALGRQKERLDEALASHLETRDIQTHTEAEAKRAARGARTALDTMQKTAMERADLLKAQAQVLAGQRKTQASLVTPALLKTYENIRAAKNGVGIAEVVDGKACGGCRMALPNAMIARLKQGTEQIVCDNCARLLVLRQK